MFWTSFFNFLSEHLAIVIVLVLVVIPYMVKCLKKVKWSTISLGPLKVKRERESLDREKADKGRSQESTLYKLASDNIARVMKHAETFLSKWVQFQLGHYRDLLEVKLEPYCTEDELAGCSEYALDHIDYHYFSELTDRMMEVIKDSIRNDMIKNHLVEIAFVDPEAYIEGKIVDLLDLSIAFLVGQYEDKVVVSFVNNSGDKKIQNYQRLISKVDLTNNFKDQFMSKPTEFMALIRRIYAYALAQARLLDKNLIGVRDLKSFKNPELLERLDP